MSTQTLQPTKGYEISKIALICSLHGFRKTHNDYRTIKGNSKDIYGFINSFIDVCEICGKVCERIQL